MVSLPPSTSPAPPCTVTVAPSASRSPASSVSVPVLMLTVVVAAVAASVLLPVTVSVPAPSGALTWADSFSVVPLVAFRVPGPLRVPASARLCTVWLPARASVPPLVTLTSLPAPRVPVAAARLPVALIWSVGVASAALSVAAPLTRALVVATRPAFTAAPPRSVAVLAVSTPPAARVPSSVRAPTVSEASSRRSKAPPDTVTCALSASRLVEPLSSTRLPLSTSSVADSTVPARCNSPLPRWRSVPLPSTLPRVTDELRW